MPLALFVNLDSYPVLRFHADQWGELPKGSWGQPLQRAERLEREAWPEAVRAWVDEVG